MNKPTNHQMINGPDGGPLYAVIPYADYLQLLASSGAAADELTVPHAVVSAMVDGATPIKAWREHLGLSQAELAGRMNVSQSALAQMEHPDANPRRATLKKIAAAMGIRVELLDVDE